MQLINYLRFDGRCQEAFEFYEQCLGGKIETMMPHEGSPIAEHVKPEWRSKIMHATLRTGDALLMGSDVPPEHYSPMKGASVMIYVEGAGNAERIFADLSKDGQIDMPLQQTFWAARFGILHDRFGIFWMLNCEQA